jgi:hypothetical protein
LMSMILPCKWVSRGASLARGEWESQLSSTAPFRTEHVFRLSRWQIARFDTCFALAFLP